MSQLAIKRQTTKDIEAQIGTLSRPSKMPCHGYSLPATECKRGSILRKIENSVCSDCYALKNRYLFNNVQKALHKRLDALLSDTFTWQHLITELINRKEKKRLLQMARQRRHPKPRAPVSHQQHSFCPSSYNILDTH